MVMTYTSERKGIVLDLCIETLYSYNIYIYTFDRICVTGYCAPLETPPPPPFQLNSSLMGTSPPYHCHAHQLHYYSASQKIQLIPYQIHNILIILLLHIIVCIGGLWFSNYCTRYDSQTITCERIQHI